MRILLRRPIKRSTASPISGILSYDQAIIPAMQPSVPILAQARGSVLRRTTGPKDGVHNYSETYPCDTCGISATVGRALCVPLHPDLHAKTGARQAVSAQVSKPSSPRGRLSRVPTSLGEAARQAQTGRGSAPCPSPKALSSSAPSPSLQPKLHIDATH